jgi:hypothetical protein
MKKYLILFLFITCNYVFAQRPTTGEKIFNNKYPAEQINTVSFSSLTVSNTIKDDVIVTLRDGGRHYISHVYIRAHEHYTFENLPVGHFVYQYHNLKTYYESPKRIPIYLNTEEFLHFYYSAGAKKIIGFEISQEEFFKE